MLQYNPTVSGSLTITGSLTVTNGVIGTVSGVDVQIFSSSINQVITGIQSSTESSDARLTFIETFTSSALTRLTNIESKSASVDISISNINTFTSSNANTSLNSKTGSYATTGSNTFVGTTIMSGSTYVQGDLIVLGSSSIQYISASSVSIGTNIVQLNTSQPAVRFGGLSVQDSGSAAGVTGSMFWDGCCNRWIYSNPSGIGYSGGVLMSGPRGSTLGNEPTLTCNYIAKSGGGDHLYDSCIIDDGTTVCVNATLKGSGTACFAGNICTPTLSVTNCINIGTDVSLGSRLSIQSANDQAGITMYNTYDCNKWSLRTGTTGVSNKGFAIFDDICNVTRIQIDSAGKVGIGTNGPQKLLHVTSNTENGIYISCYSAELVIGNNHTFASKTSSTTIALSGGDGDFIPTACAGDSIIATQSGNLLFGTGMNAGTASGTERIRITNTGITRFACQVCAPSFISNGVINWNGTIGALSYGSGYVTIETNTSNAIQLKTNGTTSLTLGTDQRATFSSTLFVGGNLYFDANATTKTISNYGYGGAVQLLRSDSTSTRWARIGMVDATATGWLGGMTIANNISANFDGQIISTPNTTAGALTVVSAAATSQCFLSFFDKGTNGNCLVANMLDANGSNAAGGLVFQVYRKDAAAGMRLISNNIVADSATGSEPVMNLSTYSYSDSAMTVKTSSPGFDHSIFGINYNDTSLFKIRANGAIVNLSSIGGASTPRFFNYCGGNGNANGLGLDMGGNSYEYSNFFAYGTADNGRMTFGSWTSNTYYQKMIILGNGNIGVPSNTAAIYNASDCRLKDNIQPIQYGLCKLMCIKPVSFNWKEKYLGTDEASKTNLGFIAQDMAEIVPEVVEVFGGSNHITLTDGIVVDTPLRINEKYLIPILVKSIQEQQCIINILKSCIGIS